MLKRHAFITGFVVSILPLLAANLAGYIAASKCCKGDSYVEAGFPVRWYAGGFVAPPHVIWDALIINTVIVVGISYAGGRILASVFQPNR